MGGAGLGNIFERIAEPRAHETVTAAWDAGIRFYDTSPWYGRGLSERRVGTALLDRPRDDFVLSTKVGRLFSAPHDAAGFAASVRAWPLGLHFDHRHDYSYAGIMRSYEDSLQRLGLNRIDLLVIHDLDLANLGRPDLVSAHMVQLATSGIDALKYLKASGRIGAFGAGVNRLGTIPQFLAAVDLDFFLVALPYTLAEQPVLDSEFPLCAEREVGIIIGSPLASGILATGAVPGAMLNYREPTAAEARRIDAMQAVCARHGIILAAAALQFPLLHPLVAAIIPGAVSPEQPSLNVEAVATPVPAALWEDLKREGLLRADAPTHFA